MKNIARVFWRDVKRLARTPAAWSVVLFLIVLPSLYTWFNVAAFWNPYDNTGNLRVCVVNEDDGVNDQLLGKLDVGSLVVSQLQDNDQLAWAFVSRDEAIDEVSAGRAYAAFVIPKTFSADIATLTTGDFKQPTLEYYVNEKTGPVSPKITDTGANALDTTINNAFFSTVSSTVADLIGGRLDETRIEVASAQNRATSRIDQALASIREARATVSELGSSVQTARGKASGASSMLSGAKGRIDEATALIEGAGGLVEGANTGLAAFTADMSTAISAGSAKVAQAASQTSLALGQTASAIETAKESLGIPAIGSGLATPDYSDVIALLQELRENVKDDQKPLIDDAIAKLEEAPHPGESWINLARDLDAAATAAEESVDPLTAKVLQALESGDEYRSIITGQAIPAISAGLAAVTSTSGNLSAAVASQHLAIDQAQAVLDELDSTLDLTASALSKTDAVLGDLESEMSTVKNDLQSLASADALGDLLGDEGLDPDKIADFMMSPTQVKREELYPLNAYGSAMAPLFINLTLWIGVFMLMVIFRLEVDDEGIKNLTIAQRTFGRGLLLAIIAALQAVVCCVGCLFMGVQTANAALFITTAVIASLSYLSIQYMLSTTLQHVGKGLCIILVFVQIPGATGLYPIEMTPDFFHAIYPLFPFTYGINAIRETICGFYDGAWASNIGVLVAFMVGFIVVGTVARPYMTNLNRLFAREIEESDIIIGESMQMPARRYRMSQVIRAFSNHDEYRQAIERRVSRFMSLYPKLKQGALIVGVVLPVIVTGILTALGVEKVVVLTTWLVWFMVIVGYLITVEYLRDYLSHLVSLEGMSDAEMRELYVGRNRFTRVQPLPGSANFLKPVSNSAPQTGAQNNNATTSVRIETPAAADESEGEATDE